MYMYAYMHTIIKRITAVSAIYMRMFTTYLQSTGYNFISCRVETLQQKERNECDGKEIWFILSQVGSLE